MGILQELHEYYTNKMKEDNESNTIKEMNLQTQQDNITITKQLFEEMKENKIRHYDKFRETVKLDLLESALTYILSKSIKDITPLQRDISNRLVHEYVVENGYHNIINLCDLKRTFALSRIYSIVTENAKKIIDKSNIDNSNSQVVNPSDRESFFNDLQNEEEFDNVANAIAMRVANAEEDMITNNIKDKLDIEQITASTQNRINSLYSSDEFENTDDIVKEAKEESTHLLNDIVHRNKNIYEQIVANLSESIITTESIKEQYMPSGKLDMDKIFESAKAMYTMLEFLNTIQLENVDEAYLENILYNM